VPWAGLHADKIFSAEESWELIITIEHAKNTKKQ